MTKKLLMFFSAAWLALAIFIIIQLVEVSNESIASQPKPQPTPMPKDVIVYPTRPPTATPPQMYVPTPTPLPTVTPSVSTTYTCPESGYVDCMPRVYDNNEPAPPKSSGECTSDYINWAQENCPNFKGAAY